MKGRPIGSAPKPPDETATLPQLRTRIAAFVAKQRDHHPDLADADYALIPELLSDPTVVLEEGAQHVLRTHRIISGDAGDLEK